MNSSFDKADQLEIILKDYPNNKELVDIEGIILDYIASKKTSLYSIFEINIDIYKELFIKDEEKETAQNLIRASVNDETTFDKLYKDCKDIFPKIREMIDNLREVSPRPEVTAEIDPDEICKFPVQLIIWQLSDIHFGDFNVLVDDPYEMAAILGRAAQEYNYKPDIILVSGDLTTRSEAGEFNKFLEFAEQLSNNLWSKKVPERFLVVPGNHDTTWQSDGTADRHKAFKDILTDQEIVLTPFETETEKVFEEGKIIGNWYADDNERVPPFGIIKYIDYDLEILLLVSSYHSGNVPDETRQVLERLSDADLKKILTEILREDKGCLSQECLLNLSKNIPETSSTRIALIHHNMIQYGALPCPNTLAPALLETLFKKKAYLLLHGHTHFTEEADPPRPIMPEHAVCVPCTSLSSHCFTYNRGFNIHLISNPQSVRKMTTVVWQLTATTSFSTRHFSPRYSFDISNQGIIIKHEGTIT